MVLKYPGGKSRVAPLIRLPKKFGVYVEPLFGGGSVFFYLASQGILKNVECFLSDANGDVVNFWGWVKNSPGELIEATQRLGSFHSEEFYYRVRDEFNQELNWQGLQNAARFLYMNRVSFNGLIRYGQKHPQNFNVPYGHREFSLDEASIYVASIFLKDVDLYQGDFRVACGSYIGDDVFIYFDPPYPGGFDRYVGRGFGDSDHEELCRQLNHIDKQGTRWCLSYPYQNAVEMYGNFRIEKITTRTSIGPTEEQRGLVDEALVYNY